MKILIVGLGSMGQRHIRNITAVLAARGEPAQIDALRATDRPLPPEILALLHRQYFDADELPRDYDAAFISNPTALHYDTIRTLDQHARHMFIEKPVFRSAADVDPSALPSEDGRVFYVACPLRYTGVIGYLKAFVETNPPYAVRAMCSTYLPDWRPQQDYRRGYSASRALGGGVSIDLIHEWDYICHLFGFPERVLSLRGKYSALELDSDDLAMYIGQYADKAISVYLDYFGRAERRTVELYCAEDTVVGDLIGGTVRFLRAGREIAFAEERDAYQRRELAAFFDMIAGMRENANPIATACRTLLIAEGAYAQ